MQKSKCKNQNAKLHIKIQNGFKNFTFYKISLIFAFCILNLLSGCRPKAQRVEIKEAIPVKVALVKLQDLSETLEYVGNIKAEDEAIVYPKVSGKIVQKLKEESSAVKKGEPIAYIDRDEVGLDFQKAPVESPLAGIIGKVYVDIGANVTAGTPIALVLSMDKVEIDLDIPQNYLPRISLGQEAKISVDAYPDEEFIGQVTKISPLVNLENRAAAIKITIDNLDHRLKSGMFAKVSLVIAEHKNIPVILKEAILGKNSQVYVYVVENKQAVLRRITLGIRQGPFYAVSEGLKAGDRVVIMGQQRLYDGAEVAPEE